MGLSPVLEEALQGLPIQVPEQVKPSDKVQLEGAQVHLQVRHCPTYRLASLSVTTIESGAAMGPGELVQLVLEVSSWEWDSGNPCPSTFFRYSGSSCSSKPRA